MSLVMSFVIWIVSKYIFLYQKGYVHQIWTTRTIETIENSLIFVYHVVCFVNLRIAGINKHSGIFT